MENISVPVNILIFDTETTGLPKHAMVDLKEQPHIIELYMLHVVYKDGEFEFVKEHDQIYSVDFKLDDVIKKITGITDEDLVGKPKFLGEEWEKVQSFIDDCSIIVAHNLQFDLNMLKIEARRNGVELKSPPRKICTVQSSINYKGYRLNLKALHRLLFGKEFDDAHRAKNDVNALYECFKEMFKKGSIKL